MSDASDPKFWAIMGPVLGVFAVILFFMHPVSDELFTRKNKTPPRTPPRTPNRTPPKTPPRTPSPKTPPKTPSPKTPPKTSRI